MSFFHIPGALLLLCNGTSSEGTLNVDQPTHVEVTILSQFNMTCRYENIEFDNLLPQNAPQVCMSGSKSSSGVYYRSLISPNSLDWTGGTRRFHWQSPIILPQLQGVKQLRLGAAHKSTHLVYWLNHCYSKVIRAGQYLPSTMTHTHPDTIKSPKQTMVILYLTMTRYPLSEVM